MRERQRDSATGGNSDIRGQARWEHALRELDESPVGCTCLALVGAAGPPQCLMAVLFWIHYLT